MMAWTMPIRLTDLAPCSAQEDVDITWLADLPVSAENVDGQRGIPASDFPLAAGETKAIAVTTTIASQDGMVRQ
jgi:hypothetical protein